MRLPYSSCMKLCNVKQSLRDKTFRWRDSNGRSFECVGKRNVLVDFARAAFACRRLGLKAVVVDPEPNWDCHSPKSGELRIPSKEPYIPVIALLGHIDHGKTTLLDRLAGTLIAPLEAGGITQHLTGITIKFSPKFPDNKDNSEIMLSFIDTPGHEALSTMRARAAAGADAAVVVVEAVKGSGLQTEEAIIQADACGLPIVFALNKVDQLYHVNKEMDVPQFMSESILKNQGTHQAHFRYSKLDESIEHSVRLQRMFLRSECQRLQESGRIKRDFSREAMEAVPLSALYGTGVEVRRFVSL